MLSAEPGQLQSPPQSAQTEATHDSCRPYPRVDPSFNVSVMLALTAANAGATLENHSRHDCESERKERNASVNRNRIDARYRVGKEDPDEVRTAIDARTKPSKAPAPLSRQPFDHDSRTIEAARAPIASRTADSRRRRIARTEQQDCNINACNQQHDRRRPRIMRARSAASLPRRTHAAE